MVQQPKSGARRRVYIPGYTGYVEGIQNTFAGTYARTSRDAHYHVRTKKPMERAETPTPDKFYPKKPNPRRKTNVSNFSSYALGDDRDWSFDTTMGSHYRVVTKIPPRHQSILPCGKTAVREILDKAYREAFDKIGKEGVEKLETDLRAKVHQKTSSEKGPMALRRAFKFFDNDESGGIDPDEFHAAMSNFGLQFTAEQILALFCHYDINRDGELGYAEFVERVMDGGTKEAREALKRSGAIPTTQWVHLEDSEDLQIKTSMPSEELDEEHCRGIFRKFDVNGTGSIDLRELQQMTRSLGLYLNNEDISNAMIDLDVDGSGDISFSEFFNWWKKKVCQINLKSPVNRRSPTTNSQNQQPESSTPEKGHHQEMSAAGENVARSRQNKYAQCHNYSYATANPFDAGYTIHSPQRTSAVRPDSPLIGGWVTPSQSASETKASKTRPASASSRPSSASPYYGKARMPLGQCYVVPERMEYTPPSREPCVRRPSSAPGWRASAANTTSSYTKHIGASRMPSSEQTGFRI